MCVSLLYAPSLNVCCPPQDIGKKLTEITPRGVLAVFETLRSVLHSKQVNSRVQYMIEVMFAVRKDKFQVLYGQI